MTDKAKQRKAIRSFLFSVTLVFEPPQLDHKTNVSVVASYLNLIVSEVPPSGICKSSEDNRYCAC